MGLSSMLRRSQSGGCLVPGCGAAMQCILVAFDALRAFDVAFMLVFHMMQVLNLCWRLGRVCLHLGQDCMTQFCEAVSAFLMGAVYIDTAITSPSVALTENPSADTLLMRHCASAVAG